MKITAPGVYDMDAEEYHKHPALSASGAATLLDTCPARFMYEREFPKPPSPALVFGQAYHCYLLEPLEFTKRFHVLDEKHNARTNAGKEVVAEAQENGLAVLKYDEFEKIKAMAAALKKHPFALKAFGENGKPEQSLFWRDERFGIWKRARCDWLPGKGRLFADYKSARDLSKEELTRALYNHGYYQRAAWYIEALKALGLHDDPVYLFIFQEKEPPFEVVVAQASPAALSWGATKNDKASAVFAECLETGKWPGYADDVIQLSLPGWAERRLEEAHEMGEFAISYEAQKPAA